MKTTSHLEQRYKSSHGSVDYLKNYSIHLSELLSGLDYSQIAIVVNCLEKARETGATIYFAGNGGSASTASHFAQDLAEVGRKTGLKLFKTLSLADNVSFITAMANDYGYENIFVNQMNNLFQKGDLLVVISASGNSPNLIEAVKHAKQLEGTTIGLVGFNGGKLFDICDHVIHVETRKGEYGPVEDIHMVLDHMISSYFMYNDIDTKGNE